MREVGYFNTTEVKRRFVLPRVLAVGAAGLLCVAPRVCAQVGTSIHDFFLPGSQPDAGVVYSDFIGSNNCRFCHGSVSTTEVFLHGNWQGSMMAQSARDPLFLACLAIANQDAAFAGDLCIRCHTPAGWVGGRSTPTDGTALTAADRDGVSCSVCHRLVDPVFASGVSPPIDAQILAALELVPQVPGNGAFVLDPEDRRRGPYDDVVDPGHPWVHSPLHRSAEICGTCHDVSNPVFVRQPDGTYALSPLDLAHPTLDKYDMFPLERTYSEWLQSDFARFGVDMGGRFGGLLAVVSTCQDCHMPMVEGRAAVLTTSPIRPDVRMHDFAGGNAWVQDMVLNLYPFDDLDPVNLEAGKQRSRNMLERACTLEVTQQGSFVRVRIMNETGHKLPSGYPEGRRMWINARFLNEIHEVVAERGAYDAFSAALSTGDTKVYEVHLGADETVAQVAGIPAGKGFHFALNNVILKDNRIPPRGFRNAAFESVQAAPVGTRYADGQYWDDTTYRLPVGACSVTVGVYYQTASKEFITFLRDENRTNDAGDVLYGQWELTGKSPPVLMASRTQTLDPYATGDYDGNGVLDLTDAAWFAYCVQGPDESVGDLCLGVFDFDADGDVDLKDAAEVQAGFLQ